jgi:hypothetical protein
MLGFIMNKKIGYIITLSVVSLGVYLQLRNSPEKITFEGNTYEYQIYDCKNQNLTFSRADKNPSLLLEHDWIIPASLTLGFAYMENLNEKQLQSYFEKPPVNAKEGALNILSSSQLVGEITVVSAETYKIGKESYLLIGLKRSDLPDGVLYSPLLRDHSRWIKPSRSRDPNGEILDLMRKLSKEVNQRQHKLIDISHL